MSVESEILFRAITGDYRGTLTEAQELILRAAIRNRDLRLAHQLMIDWGYHKRAWITKWIPGNHYYAEGKKFDTYKEAEQRLTDLGFDCLGLKETEVPRSPIDGD